MTTTFRADVVAGLTTILDAFIAANPTLLRKRFKVRPESTVNDLPYAYIDLRPESIGHSAGIRTRTMSPSVVVVDQLADNGETLARFDTLVDTLVDHFTDYPHVTTGTVWDAMTVADEPEDGGRAAVRFTFGNLSIMEGRT